MVNAAPTMLSSRRLNSRYHMVMPMVTGVRMICRTVIFVTKGTRQIQPLAMAVR